MIDTGGVDIALRSALDALDGRTRRIAGYHLGFWDAAGAPTDGGGKRLRPRLALLGAAAVGAPYEWGVRAGVACELIHDFSLLHDDVLDRDVSRRHRPAAWTVFGTEPALEAGNAMRALAIDVLAEAPTETADRAVATLVAATDRLLAGQEADVSFETRDDVTLDECLAMAQDKTGALIACAAALAPVLADSPDAVVGVLADFGEHVGLAFQLVDDILGIWGDPLRTGKPVLSDLRSRKKSLPVVAALTLNPTDPAATELAAWYRARPAPPSTVVTPVDATPDDELVRAADLVATAGGLAWARARADAELEAALARLDALLAAGTVPPPVHRDLAALARQLADREA